MVEHQPKMILFSLPYNHKSLKFSVLTQCETWACLDLHKADFLGGIKGIFLNQLSEI